MPIYVYTCDVGHSTDIFLHPTEERKDSIFCKCGRSAVRDIRREHITSERIFRPFFNRAARRWIRSPGDCRAMDREMDKKGFVHIGLEHGG